MGKPVPPEVRTQIINEYRNQDKVPVTMAELGRRYGIPKGTVHFILRKHKQAGGFEEAHSKASRRSAIIQANLERAMEIWERNPNISGRQLAKELDLGKDTACRMLKELRGKSRVQEVGKEREGEGLVAVAGPSSDLGTESFYLGPPVATPVLEMEGGSNSACDWEPLDSSFDPDLGGCTASSAAVSTMERAELKKCFVCDSIDDSPFDFAFPPSTQLPECVERSTWVICFLRVVLGMESDDLANLMESEANGRNPNEWEISICNGVGCRGVVEQAFGHWREIKRLEVELRKRREEILEGMRRCKNHRRRKVDVDDQTLLTKRVREVLRRGNRKKSGVGTEVQLESNEINVKIEPEVLVEEFIEFGEEGPLFGDVGDADARSDSDWDPGDTSKPSPKTRKRKYDQSFLHKPRRGRPPKWLAALRKANPKEVKSKRERKSKLVKPIKQEGPDEGIKYSCGTCPTLEEMDMDKFIAHLCFHSSHPNKCSECNFYFPQNPSPQQVQKHWEECHPNWESGGPKVIQVTPMDTAGKIWACSVPTCEEKFGSAEERNGHLKMAHEITDSRISCPICSTPTKFQSVTELRLHKAIEHPEHAEFSCPFCDTQCHIQSEKEGVRFLNFELLKAHISQEHHDRACISDKGEVLKAPRFLQTCPFCGLVLCNAKFTVLDIHINREHGRKLYETYSCSICEKKMRHADVWRHTRIKHWPEAPRKYLCQYCGKGFRHLENQKDHEQIHKNKDTRPYQCELCGSSFAVRTYLNIHMRVTHRHQLSPSALRLRKKRFQNREWKVSPEDLSIVVGVAGSMMGPVSGHEHLLNFAADSNDDKKFE